MKVSITASCLPHLGLIMKSMFASSAPPWCMLLELEINEALNARTVESN